MKVTGRLPSGEHLEQLKKSPNYNGSGFVNLSPTPMLAENASYWKITKDFFRKKRNAFPSSKIPSVISDLNNLGSDGFQLVWFGHSSYLARMNGKNILVDPVLSGNASPLSFLIKSFVGTNVYGVNEMPGIDYLVLTHDHYDHLDYKTVIGLKQKVKSIYCSLGLGSHLKYWGIDPAIIHEMDWWEEKELGNDMKLIATPARHFSRRGFKRAQTLWSSFVLKSSTHSLFIGGDSGYDSHFKVIGEKFGYFDVAVLEAGQYNLMWPHIHMMPEETVQAAVDLNAKLLLPVHWGKFSLAMHAWNEPAKRVVKAALELNMPVITPRIGEVVEVGKEFHNTSWYEM